jgi:hypothetical protein
LAAIFARLNGQSYGLERWIDELQPDLAINSKEIPPMVRTGVSRIAPGKMDEAKAIFHELIFPAVKKSGATSYGVAYARLGTPTNEIHSYIGLSGWGDFDGPLGSEKGMTSAEYKTLLARLSTVVESTEWTVWKFHPDLSYIPPK